MTTLTIDSSIIVKWLNQDNEPHLKQAETIFLQAVKDKSIQIITSELAKYEVGNVLTVSKQLTKNKTTEALDFLYSLPLKYYSETLESTKITSKLSHKFKITYYDAAFIQVALTNNTALITDNPKHQTKVKGVKVIALKDYK